MPRKLSRRRYVVGTGAAVTTGLLAGCADDPDGDGGEPAGDDDGTPEDEEMADEDEEPADEDEETADEDEETADEDEEETADGGNGDVPSEIDDYLADARLYDGELDDHTGEDEVTVLVGGGDDGLAFEPAAIRIDAGATVRWEWTGEGGAHNVNSAEESDTDFESGDPVDDADEVFEQSFDDTGVQLYQCDPHIGVGMLGGIDVVEADG